MGRGVVLDTVHIGTLSFVTLTSLFANCLLLAASLHRKSDVTSGDLLMAAMSVADMLLALVIPVNVLADFEVFGSGLTMECVLANSTAVSLPCLSLFMLIALTTERCVNIFLPLRASTLITRTRVIVVVVIVYLYAILLTTLLPLVGHNLHIRDQTDINETADCNFAAVATAPLVAFLLLGNLVPGMFVLLFLNGAIFCVARKHLHRMTISEYRRQKSHNNAVMFVCQLYILSYLPVTIAICIDFEGFGVYMIQEWRAPFLLYVVGMFMGTFSTVVFPLILIKGNSLYRRWITTTLLPCCCCRRRTEDESSRQWGATSSSRDKDTGSETDTHVSNHSREWETRFNSDNTSQTPDPAGDCAASSVSGSVNLHPIH